MKLITKKLVIALLGGIALVGLVVFIVLTIYPEKIFWVLSGLVFISGLLVGVILLYVWEIKIEHLIKRKKRR